MILIEITNVKDLVKDERGWLTAHVGGYLTDLEAKVEAQVITQLQAGFAERGLETNIASVAGMKMRDVEADRARWRIRKS